MRRCRVGEDDQVEYAAQFSDDIFPSRRSIRRVTGLKDENGQLKTLLQDLHSIVIAVMSSESSFCCTQLGDVVGFVAFVFVAPVVAIVRQVMIATAPAITTMTKMLAMIRIASKMRFSFTVIFSVFSCSSTIDSRTTVAIDATCDKKNNSK